MSTCPNEKNCSLSRTGFCFPLLVLCFCLGTFFVEKANVARTTGPADRAVFVGPLPFEHKFSGTITNYEVMYSLGPLNNSRRPDGKQRAGCREFVMEQLVVPADGLALEETAGRCGAAYKPWIIVRHRKTHRGLALWMAYPGNWRISLLPKGKDTVLRAVTLPETLTPFEHIKDLPVPGVLVAEFQGSWDDGAQKMVQYVRRNFVRKLGDDWPWVDFNTWLSCGTKPDMKCLTECARVAAQLGCDIFVLDTGWYGKSPHWGDALGDWHVNRKRFPQGLEPLVSLVRKLGMKFGIWFEIENTGKDADVVKQHPEWLLRDKGRLVNGRGTLDFGKPKVVRWACEQIDRVVETYHPDYIKMDFNVNLVEDSKSYTSPTSPLSRHYRGLGLLWEHIRSKYPNIIVENCSSGSLREDMFTLAHVDTEWLADAVESKQNLAINYGATYILPPEVCHHWTCYPEPCDALDTEAAFLVSMMGHMGISGPVLRWSQEIKQQAKKSIALYKRLRPILRKSVVFHLTPQAQYGDPHSFEAALYVDRKDAAALLFAFQGGAPELQCKLNLRGLNPETRYRIRALMPEKELGVPEREATGAELAAGFDIRFPHKGAATLIQFTQLR